MTLPTPREVAEQIIRDNSELGLNRASEDVLADRERVREACAQAAEDAVANGVIVCSAAEVGNYVRGLPLTGQ